MKNPFRSVPPPGSLGAMEVHEVVREFPELTLPLKAAGVDLIEWGVRRLEETPRYGEAWLEVLLGHLAWRGDRAI